MKNVSLGNYSISISNNVLEILSNYKQKSKRQKEAGGILLGQIKNKRVYLNRISTPSCNEKATRTSFYRDKAKAQFIIDYEFINSNNKTIYLGEWHTHPEKHPIPSSIDKRMIRDQFIKNELNESFLLFIIQGTESLLIGKIEGNSIISKLLKCDL